MSTQTEILGVMVEKLTMAETLAWVRKVISLGTPQQVVTANPEIIYASLHDMELKQILNKASLITADGIGVVWASRILGEPVPERVTGIDLMTSLIKLAAENGYKLFFLGAAPGVAAQAAELCQEFYPNLQIVGTHHGFFTESDEQEINDMIKDAKPDILFVGLGAPRQEKWIHKNLNKLNIPVSIGVGGCFDVISGQKKRAPIWTQKLGLEWLYRLYKEPSRSGRMLVLPKFMGKVLLTRLQK